MLEEISAQSFWLSVLVAILCGFIIGVERQARGKPVGIRTSILICLGTTLFIFLGQSINDGHDVARVLGQLITGVGFLGAGVIMNRGDVVVGVTSAAVVWLLAGIDASIGLGQYVVAVFITIVAVAVLIGAEWLEAFYVSLTTGAHEKNK